MRHIAKYRITRIKSVFLFSLAYFTKVWVVRMLKYTTHGLRKYVFVKIRKIRVRTTQTAAPTRPATFPACAVTSISAKSLFRFSLRLLSKIFSLFIEQNHSFPSFLVIIISLPSKLVKRNYLTVRYRFYKRHTFPPLCLPPCGVLRYMGRSSERRTAACRFQTLCSSCLGLRQSVCTRLPVSLFLCNHLHSVCRCKPIWHQIF